MDSIEFKNARYDAIEDCDALILITEWKEFRNPNFDLFAEKLNQKIIFDGRNIYDKKIENKGFELYQIGCWTHPIPYLLNVIAWQLTAQL